MNEQDYKKMLKKHRGNILDEEGWFLARFLFKTVGETAGVLVTGASGFTSYYLIKTACMGIKDYVMTADSLTSALPDAIIAAAGIYGGVIVGMFSLCSLFFTASHVEEYLNWYYESFRDISEEKSKIKEIKLKYRDSQS